MPSDWCVPSEFCAVIWPKRDRSLRSLGNSPGHVRNEATSRGVSVSVVSKLLGHGSISTTLNIYAHVLAENLQQFERQRAPILGCYRALDGHLTHLTQGEFAEGRQVA
jgi:hypothetical protein